MKNTHLQDYWEQEYQNTRTQFDIDQPDRWVAQLEKAGKIKGSILDAGCGPGRTSLYLASLGYTIVGADIAGNAIARAKGKAAQAKLPVTFLQADMTKFASYENYFATVIDIGCFHSLPGEQDRQAYAKVLSQVCTKQVNLYLRAFSDKNLVNVQHPQGVPAISEQVIKKVFCPAQGWQINDLQEKQIELLVANGQRKQGYCWFAEIAKSDIPAKRQQIL